LSAVRAVLEGPRERGALGLLRRSQGRDGRARPRPLPRSPLPRSLGRRRARRFARESRAADDRRTLRHARGARKPTALARLRRRSPLVPSIVLAGEDISEAEADRKLRGILGSLARARC